MTGDPGWDNHPHPRPVASGALLYLATLVAGAAGEAMVIYVATLFSVNVLVVALLILGVTNLSVAADLLHAAQRAGKE